MPVAVNDIIQMSLVGSKEVQTIMNVLHYRCVTAPSTGTVADNLAALADHMWGAAGSHKTEWLDIMPDDYTLQRARFQVIEPTRLAYFDYLIAEPGTVENPVDWPNSMWSITKQSEDTGRRSQGNMQIVLADPTWVANGELSLIGLALRQAWAGKMIANVTVAAGGVYEAVIYNKGGVVNHTKITHYTIQQTIRTVRRRTVRLGI